MSVAATCKATPQLRISPDAIKDPAEPLKVEIDFYDMCVIRWRPNELVASSEYMRPPIPNGFAYQATTGGTTGSKLPRLPTVLAQTVQDGSVTWSCVAAGTNALNAITSPTAVSEPAGLSISSVSVSESRKILATYSGGVDGQDYFATFTFTLDGVSRVARQLVQVRKR